MDLFEVLELWHLADQVIVELFSIYLAGTFALLIAAFSAGPGLRGFVLFPGMITPIFLHHDGSIRAVEDAVTRDQPLHFVAQRTAALDHRQNVIDLPEMPGRQAPASLERPRRRSEMRVEQQCGQAGRAQQHVRA